MNQIAEKTDIVEKEKLVYDLIISNTTYAYADYNQSCAGVFLEGKAVCAGYSEAFVSLCNGAGINTICVTSTEHEWNMVQIDGGWYNVDCTWNDHDDGEIYDKYFNTDDEVINEGYHEIEAVWNGLAVPTCTSASTGSQVIYNGIDYSDVYDENYYVSQYSDVKAAFGTDCAAALEHFVKYGMLEGRQGSSNFNVYSYRSQYDDLRRAFGSNLKSYYMHYVQNGKQEGRRGIGCNSLQGAVTKYKGIDYTSVYSFGQYTAAYSDIKNYMERMMWDRWSTL